MEAFSQFQMNVSMIIFLNVSFDCVARYALMTNKIITFTCMVIILMYF